MDNRLYRVICVVTIVMLTLAGGISVYSAEPTGAKGMFELEGSTVSVETENGTKIKKTTVISNTRGERGNTSNAVNVADGPHVGIKYQVVLLSGDGSSRPVSDKRVFRTGDRIKIIAQSNKPGNMAVYNVGPTGNVNYLFNGPVSSFTPIEIPQGTAMRIVDPPGTESIFFELSGASDNIAVEARADCKPSVLMVGSKDIVVEDTIGTNYAVYSRDNCSLDRSGSKDIVLESDSGTNYGVIPSALIDAGKSFLVQVKLKHRG
ncbi:MAG: DUF4384 domain-containing protein [Nitrospirae bacterium]|nr:DUF4384 domain-containing protein [Nitrospirota bacterium]MBF0592019.1 DUF4384 domain-containing protein [Nitrospirota bacterium]